MKIFLKSDMLIRAKNLTLWKKQPTQIRKMTIGKRPLRGITGLAIVLNGLLCNGLQIKSFEEYDYSLFNLFGNMIAEKNGTFKIAGKNGEIPMLFSVVAVKPPR